METELKPRHTCPQTETLSTAAPRLYESHRRDFKSDWTLCDIWLKSLDGGKEGSEKSNWKSTCSSFLEEIEILAWKHQFHQPHPFQGETTSRLCHNRFHAPSQDGYVSAESGKRAGIHHSGLDRLGAQD